MMLEMKSWWLLCLVIIFISGCVKEKVVLDELQTTACDAASEHGTCDRLEGLGIVTVNDCCSALGKCCDTALITGHATASDSSISLAEFKNMLVNAIKDYFISETPKFTTAELKDLIVAYLSTPSNNVDLSGKGGYSGNKLTDIYNKAKGIMLTTLSFESSPFGIHPAIPYDEANNIGIKWTRCGGGPYIFWSLVDPQMSGDPNKFQWKGMTDKGPFDYDTAINSPHNAGLEVMWNIEIQAPGTGKEYHKSNSWLPANEAAYKNFVKEASKRYPFVKYWQIGNEPVANSKLADYGKFVLLTYEAIKEGNPQAKVLIGGTPGLGNPQTIEEYKTEFDRAYLPLLQDIATLDKRSFDIFDFHWYGDAVDDYKRAKEIQSYISQKISELKIPAPEEYWITEMGTYSGDPKGTAGRIDWPYQSERHQAIDVIKRYVYPLSFGIKKIFLAWGLKEGFHYDETYFDFTGLIYDGKFAYDLGDGVRKLSYYTYKKMIEILEGSDWNNIETVVENSKMYPNVYVYKFTKNGKPIWVAWNDNSESQQVTISGITANQVKITEAVPKYESGKQVTDYNTAFNTETKSVSNGKITITLKDKPVFIEEYAATVHCNRCSTWLANARVDFYTTDTTCANVIPCTVNPITGFCNEVTRTCDCSCPAQGLNTSWDVNCVASCACTDIEPGNQCNSSGARQCSGNNAYKTCGNYDADSCLEWGTATNCPSGQTCSNGQCVSPLQNCTGTCKESPCSSYQSCSSASGSCTTGYCCTGTCSVSNATQYHMGCYNGNIYWLDTNNKPVELIQDCKVDCAGGWPMNSFCYERSDGKVEVRMYPECFETYCKGNGSGQFYCHNMKNDFPLGVNNVENLKAKCYIFTINKNYKNNPSYWYIGEPNSPVGLNAPANNYTYVDPSHPKITNYFITAGVYWDENGILTRNMTNVLAKTPCRIITDLIPFYEENNIPYYPGYVCTNNTCICNNKCSQGFTDSFYYTNENYVNAKCV